MATIDLCMSKARTKAEFLCEMERRGYQVRWEDKRKYITYTTPNGKKCRDDRLHDERYRKEVMERELRIREAMLHGGAEKIEPAAGADYSPDASPLSHSGAMGGAVDRSEQPAPSAGGAEPPVGAGAIKADGLCYEGAGGRDDETALYDTGEYRTGWEKERAAAFAAAQAPSAGSVLAHAPGSGPHSNGTGSVWNPLVRLGHRLEQSLKPFLQLLQQ